MFAGKKNTQSGFYHKFEINSHGRPVEIIIRVMDGSSGGTYDLLLNGLNFNNSPSLSLQKLEDMRNSKISFSKNKVRRKVSATPVKQLSFKDFTKQDSSSLDSTNIKTIESKEKKDVNLLGISSSPDKEKDNDLITMNFHDFHNQGKSKKTTKEIDLLGDLLS